MTTYTYIKHGRMSQRPYHLVAKDEETAVCGAVTLRDAGAISVAMAPNPAPDGLICEACRQKAALNTVQRVAASSPFAEAR
ncbi:MAG: hypothetical protein KC425_18535 [Anaerolineales bacterium]|nr:hypothetical protein [Anaerolineales bacterium]